jgi:hypothetical protein
MYWRSPVLRETDLQPSLWEALLADEAKRLPAELAKMSRKRYERHRPPTRQDPGDAGVGHGGRYISADAARRVRDRAELAADPHPLTSTSTQRS